MHTQLCIAKDNLTGVSEINSNPPGGLYTFNPQSNYHWCFLHKLSSAVKGCLEELAR
ncbi:hypothetical protein DFH28DRAFT_886039 [Melampsora americana]|nr:hypothetical protein DFH28DRAFT_886039 [Melampsora americana]